MANIIKLLNILKWNTDEKHALTQKTLRELSDEADKCMGYKSTFKRQLLSIADTLNEGKKENELPINFEGYNDYKSKNETHHIGHIFYRHEITNDELYFIIKQIHGIPFEHKARLTLKLIRSLGTKYFANSTNKFLESFNFNKPKSIEFTDNNTINSLQEIIQTIEFPTYLQENIYSNLTIIGDAIARKKLLSFRPSIINKDGSAQTFEKETYFVSPYCIIFYKGYYWLIGNRRLKNTYVKDGWHYNQYSDTLDIYRIDKLLDLSIAKNTYELQAKIGFANNKLFKEQLAFLSSKIHIYKDNVKIKGTSDFEDYGFIEFEIIFDNFPQSSDFDFDFSFIFDTFGRNFSIRQDNEKTIACVHAYDDCFIDWALMNIDKIKILDTCPNANSIKKKLEKILTIGLSNLR